MKNAAKKPLLLGKKSAWLGKFLTQKDASISGKSLAWIGIAGSLMALAFADRSIGDDIVDFIVPWAEWHTSNISIQNNQGMHSSHGSHASSGDSGTGDG